jgi:hypothetical protein
MKSFRYLENPAKQFPTALAWLYIASMDDRYFSISFSPSCPVRCLFPIPIHSIAATDASGPQKNLALKKSQGQFRQSFGSSPPNFARCNLDGLLGKSRLSNIQRK